jgi:hypothetical protein
VTLFAVPLTLCQPALLKRLEEPLPLLLLLPPLLPAPLLLVPLPLLLLVHQPLLVTPLLCPVAVAVMPLLLLAVA